MTDIAPLVLVSPAGRQATRLPFPTVTGSSSREPFRADQVTVRPANEATPEDLAAILGVSDAGRCQCQRLKVRGWMWTETSQDEREGLLQAQTHVGDAGATVTSGLIAYVDGQPAGWAAVEPRTAYLKLRRKPLVWAGRNEDKDDESVWAVTCLVVRKEFRGRGLTYLMVPGVVDFARDRGASALEAYPMITQPGKVITWGELHVGARQVFADAGFREVTHPTPRRFVMRLDYT